MPNDSLQTVPQLTPKSYLKSFGEFIGIGPNANLWVEDCDVQDLAEVVLRTTNNIDPERDIQFTMGPIDSLDHASRLPNYGSKMGIDATRKWPAEGFNRPWPQMLTMDASVKARVDMLWKKLGIE